MLFYLIVASITTGLAFLYTKTKKSQKNKVFILLILFPSIVSGLRGVGTDYVGYNSSFLEIITGINEYVDYNSGYVLLLKVLGNIGLDFQVLIFFTSILFLYATFKVYRIYENDINFTLAVFSFMLCFYQISFNIFRQMLAVSIFFVGIVELCKQKNKRKFWISYVIASFIHSATIPFGIIYFLKEKLFEAEYMRLRIFIYTLVSVLIFMIPQFISSVDVLLRLIPRYGWYITRFFLADIGFGIVRYLVLAVLPVYLIYRNNLYSDIKEKGMEFLPFFSIMGYVLWLTSYISESTLFRISYFLLIVIPILHGYIFRKILLAKRIKYLFLVVCALLTFWLYDGIVLNSGGSVPYLFFWEAN